MKEGQYLYHVQQEILGPELIIKRSVLLTWDEQHDRYEIGDSKNPKSCHETGRISDRNGSLGPLGMRCETPVEAVNLYVKTCIANNETHITLHEAEIKRLKAENKSLLKIDHTKLKTDAYDDSWEPCDY